MGNDPELPLGGDLERGRHGYSSVSLCGFAHIERDVPEYVPLRRRTVAARALPPGPRQPMALQTLGWGARPIPYMERLRARYGKRFTLRLVGQPPLVMLSDPDEVKLVFTAPPDVPPPGGGGSPLLEPVLGLNSVILLDEGDHLEQRKLMLPAFHGE